jgi:hypothetical protein
MGAVLCGLTLLAVTISCQAQRRLSAQEAAEQAVISEIKSVQQSLGFEPTRNFLQHSHQTEAVYRCYYTGKFELPESYEGLRLREGTREGCAIDETKYDVFFYPIEAVASGDAQVTGSLSQASEERLAVVVSHEDFHNQDSLQKLPEAMREAAATLAGFLTAAEYAREKSGAASEQHEKLAREAEIFLRKSEIVNAYHAKTSRLYENLRQGMISETAALAGKERLFEDLSRECSSVEPASATFNRCPPVLNNAALAFDRTYTKDYPLLYDLFLACGSDLKKMIEVLSSLSTRKDLSEQEAERALRELIGRAW